jgi:hypothetical protein
LGQQIFSHEETLARGASQAQLAEQVPVPYIPVPEKNLTGHQECAGRPPQAGGDTLYYPSPEPHSADVHQKSGDHTYLVYRFLDFQAQLDQIFHKSPECNAC